MPSSAVWMDIAAPPKATAAMCRGHSGHPESASDATGRATCELKNVLMTATTANSTGANMQAAIVTHSLALLHRAPLRAFSARAINPAVAAMSTSSSKASQEEDVIGSKPD
mmetsp:Transcript_59419/g.118067  ORF Transcript_59419/g.118067 Transcript_59419/m.118067 type:complete len:111 (+) Transcript_59419:377-709(+)